MLRPYAPRSRARRPDPRPPPRGREWPELFARRGPVYVRRHQARSLLLELEPPSELRGGGRLARALQSHQQDHRGTDRREVEPLSRAAQQADELVADRVHHPPARAHPFCLERADRPPPPPPAEAP